MNEEDEFNEEEKFKNELVYEFGYSNNEINMILEIQMNTFSTYNWVLDTIRYIKRKSLANTEQTINMLKVLLEYYYYSYLN